MSQNQYIFKRTTSVDYSMRIRFDAQRRHLQQHICKLYKVSLVELLPEEGLAKIEEEMHYCESDKLRKERLKRVVALVKRREIMV